MIRRYIPGFLLLTLFDTLAQVSLKFAAEGLFPFHFGAPWMLRVVCEPWVYAAGFCYIVAFTTWMRLLKHVPVGVAFMASHLEIVGVLTVSFLWLGETITPTQAVGVLFILLGIGLLGLRE